MNRIGLAATAICAGISLLLSVPCFASAPPAAGDAQTGTLAGGVTYILRPDPNAATAAIELWYRAPASGYDNATPGIARLAVAAVAASAPPHGTSLAQLIARSGGSLSINVYPDITEIGISVPSAQGPAMLRALTGAYFSGTVTDGGLKAAARDTAVAAAESHFDSDRLLQDALFAHLFSAGPAHYAPIPVSAADLNKITQSDVSAFAGRAFRRSNAILSVAGNFEQPALSAVRAASPTPAGSPDPPIDSTLSNANVDVTQPAQVGGIGFAWIGPPIADVKAATAMDFIADYLFDSEHGTLAQTLRGSGDAYVNGQFITLHDPGVLLVTASGATPAKLRSAIVAAVQTLQQPLDGKTFAGALQAFQYHILSQTQTPVSRADNFGWYAAEGNLPYAPGDSSSIYFQAARSLDPQYVVQIAHQYLAHPAVVQLLTSAAGGTTA